MERNGFVRGEYGARGPNRPGTILVLEPGQRLRGIVLRLLPQSVITGQVFDEDGEPVPNVQIQALQYSYVRGRRQLTPAEQGTTNDLGEYRIHGLAPGRYFISAIYATGRMQDLIERFPGDGRGESVFEESYAPTYYPGTNDPASAMPIELSPGNQVRGIDLMLLRTPTVRIRGRVSSSASSRPARNAIIILFPRDSARLGFFNRTATVQDPQGNFEIRGVPPGSYILYAQWGDGSARLPVDAWGPTIEGVNLVITPNLEFSGRVRVEGRKDVNLNELRISLPSRDSPLNFAGDRVKPDGSFALQNVAPDTYTVNVIGLRENLYVKSVRLGSEDVLETSLRLSSGGTTNQLEVLLSPGGGELEGVVVDDHQNAFNAATVVLVPDARRRNQLHLYKTTSTDQYGRFLVRGIAPGEYKLFAWEDVESGAYQDPDFLGPFESLGQTVTIREYSHQTLQLKVIPAEDTPWSGKKKTP